MPVKPMLRVNRFAFDKFEVFVLQSAIGFEPVGVREDSKRSPHVCPRPLLASSKRYGGSGR